MNAVTLIAGILLSSSFAMADVNKGVIDHLSWVQKSLDDGRQCIDAAATNTIVGNDVADLCMTQICGPADKLVNSDEMSIELMRDPKFISSLVPTAKSLSAAISAFLEESSKENAMTIEAYRDLQKRSDFSSDPAYAKLHDMTSMSRELNRSAFKAGPSANLPVVLDREATALKFNDLPEDQRKWAIDSIDYFLRSSIGSQYLLLNLLPPKDYLNKKYPNLSFKEALKAEGIQAQKTASNLLNGPQSSLTRTIAGAEHVLTNPTIAKAAKGEDMTEAEVTQFMNSSSSAVLFNDVLSSKAQGGQTALLPISSPESMRQFVQRKKITEIIDNYEKDLKNVEKLAEKKNAVQQACGTNYIFHMATLPNSAELAVTEKNAAWAKNRTKEVLDPVLSVHTKKMLNSVIDNSFFSMPKNRETFHQYFMDELRAKTKSSAAVAGEYEAMIKNGKHKELTLLNIRLYADNYTLDKHFKEAQQFCDKFKIETIKDNAMTSTGQIEVSWVSARKPELGKAIMLHELGHIAFGSIDSEKSSTESRKHFKEIRQCLAGNHPDGVASQKYVSEDWADLIAAKGAGRENSNIGCGLNGQKDNKYTNLTLGTPESKDVHSTDFFRALSYHKAQNGKLPSACNQIVKSQGSTFKFDSCF